MKTNALLDTEQLKNELTYEDSKISKGTIVGGWDSDGGFSAPQLRYDIVFAKKFVQEKNLNEIFAELNTHC